MGRLPRFRDSIAPRGGAEASTTLPKGVTVYLPLRGVLYGVYQLNTTKALGYAQWPTHWKDPSVPSRKGTDLKARPIVRFHTNRPERPLSDQNPRPRIPSRIPSVGILEAGGRPRDPPTIPACGIASQAPYLTSDFILPLSFEFRFVSKHQPQQLLLKMWPVEPVGFEKPT